MSTTHTDNIFKSFKNLEFKSTVSHECGVTLNDSARYQADTVNVGPGQRYDVVWTARKPGKWLVHCHIPHHTANNNVENKGGGGLMIVLDVK